MSLSQIPTDEFWAFTIYYFTSIALCVLVTGLIWVFRPKDKRGGALNAKIECGLLFIPLIIWICYFAITARNTFIITSLDSENNAYAAVVYKKFFDIDLNGATKLAMDDKQTGNVRFYASCRIADLLAGKDDNTRIATLRKVENASEFRTGFGGTNEITCGFFIPNHAEGPYAVREVIEKRLQFDSNLETVK